MVGGEVKVATVTSENLDTMATLPISVSRQSHQQHQQQAEKTAAATAVVKEKEPEAPTKPHFMYHQIKRTSMFVVLSLLYGKLVIVACIAFVVSNEISTNSLPKQYYEGFFTVLYGVSIVFLLYLFCFLLQDSSCCPGGGKKEKKAKPVKSAAKKKEKGKKESSAESGATSQGSRGRPNVLQKGNFFRKREADSIDTSNEVEFVAQYMPTKKPKLEVDLTEDVVISKKEDVVLDPLTAEDKKAITILTPLAFPTLDDSTTTDTLTTDKDLKPEPKREVYPRKIKDKAKSRDDSERVECSADSTDAEEVTSLVGIGSGKKGKNPSEEKLTEPSPDSIDIEASSSDGEYRRRKTSQNLHHYGSFFLRIGAIAFGLGTMIYIGLQFGTIFEIPMHSPCYELLQFLNPILQMVFTFMQMYFIFMNARLKIHRFKFIARFGLMHVMATNLCVWIKTLVYESLFAMSRESISYFTFPIVKTIANEVNLIGGKSTSPIGGQNTLRTPNRALSHIVEPVPRDSKTYFEHLSAASQQIPYALLEVTTSAGQVSPSTATVSTTLPSTTAPSTVAVTSSVAATIKTTLAPLVAKTSSVLNATQEALIENVTTSLKNTVSSVPSTNASTKLMENKTSVFDAISAAWYNPPANLTAAYRNDSCGRLNIMGNIVQDAAPFLYPFVIEYSLIGAAVIFVMWRHIGRSPRYVSEENIEHKLEAILSQRAVAIAQAQNGSRVDCVGASKGLFFGLLLLVGSLICMLLFFVLIHHEQFSWLAVYLADASHSTVMALSILAIIIGFCRAKNLKFYAADTTDLNDILLRVSAFGLFVYASFSIIAGARYALIKEQNLLVLVTGAITVFQVVLQLLFIGDMSKRHVYLPEHDRNKPGRQIVTFLLICNITMWILFTFESQKVLANPVQLDFFGDKAWKLVEHLTLPLCIFHRFHSAVALAEIWKNSYKPRIG